MKPLKMINTVQKYSWGSVDFIPDLLGVEQNGENWAELWMGDHLRAPSLVNIKSRNIPLRQLFEEFPEEMLGSNYRQFNGKLPFLFKVLSSESPLSLQAHPDKKTAENGFLEENRKGIPLDAFNRNYKDNNHKPEIICALTPFTAMCGFLSPRKIESNFNKLESSAFSRSLESSFKQTNTVQIESFFRSLMVLEKDKLKELIASALKWANISNSIESELVLKFAGLYDTDPGILAPLFLNIYNLKPGEALYQGPGELHAYVEGSGIELMSNSDNVLRGGLTPKYIDTDELLKVLNLKTADRKVLLPRESSPGIFEYTTPSEEFCLKLIKNGISTPVRIDNRSSLEILICTAGEVNIIADSDTIHIVKGESVLIPASVSSYFLEGSCELYSAGIPGKRI
ncbi:MAG: mannose-6-phosphate isomerase, class I [Spirochaetales bacterium]|nr:mannose-6-phosphate isomerase, class I [Spirochaetales bacterium]